MSLDLMKLPSLFAVLNVEKLCGPVIEMFGKKIGKVAASMRILLLLTEFRTFVKDGNVILIEVLGLVCCLLKNSI